MTEQQWKWIERAGWIAGIVSAIIAFIALFPPPTTPGPPLKEKEVAPQVIAETKPEAAPITKQTEKLAETVEFTLPKPKPTETDDIILIKNSFGDMIGTVTEDRWLSPQPPHKKMLRKWYNLEVLDQSLSLRFMQVQVEKDEPWDATNVQTKDRRFERLIYDCIAPLAQLQPPEAPYRQVVTEPTQSQLLEDAVLEDPINLNCSADKDCWRCSRTTERSFDPQEADSKHLNKTMFVQTNKYKGKEVRAALKRLMTKQTSYR